MRLGKFHLLLQSMQSTTAHMTDTTFLDALLASGESGAALNLPGPLGSTALIRATTFMEGNAVEHLLSLGASPNIEAYEFNDTLALVDKKLRTPLLSAAAHGNTAAIKVLLEAGAAVDQGKSDDGVTPLVRCAMPFQPRLCCLRGLPHFATTITDLHKNPSLAFLPPRTCTRPARPPRTRTRPARLHSTLRRKRAKQSVPACSSTLGRT